MLHQRSKSADTGLSMANTGSASTHKKKKSHGPPPRDSSLFNQTSQHSTLMLPSISRPGGALARSHSITNLHNLVSSLHQQREKHSHSSHRKKGKIPPLPLTPFSTTTVSTARCKSTTKGNSNTHKTVSDTIGNETLTDTTTTTTTDAAITSAEKPLPPIKRNASLTKKLTDQASHYFRLVKKKSLRSLQGKSSRSTPVEAATAMNTLQSYEDFPRIHRADVRVRVKEIPADLARPLHAEIEELTSETAATAGTSLSANNSTADEDFALATLNNPSGSGYASHWMTPPHSPTLPFDTLVQRGIRYHERGELDNATAEFAQAAKERSSIGMFFYGLSLCHGWGCDPQQDLGYLYLSKSVSSGHPRILNIENVLGGTTSEELLAAIYDLGTTFRDGSHIGCPKDEKIAAFYFKMAADLGHPDAQYALAKCYQHGLGVEQDLKLATSYYHKAAAPDDDQPSWLYTNKECSDTG